MTIDSAKANAAAASANVAQANANLATDGAPIHTDGAEGPDGQLGAFQAIFQQLSQQIAIEKAAPEAQPTEAADAPKLPSAPNLPHLPNLPDVPPAAVANQQVAAEVTAKELPQTPQTPQAKPIKAVGTAVASQQSPVPPTVAKAVPNVPANLNIDAKPPEVDESAQDVKPHDTEAPQKPQKQTATKCDAAVPPPPIPAQPVEVAKAVETQDVQEAQPVMTESSAKRRPAQIEKITLPKVKEVDEGPPKEVQPRKIETDIQQVEIPEQMPEGIPVSAKDESAPQEKRIEPAKLEFTLPQPHVLQKEIDQPAPPPPLPPEQAFIAANHPKIVTAIHGELLPNGGSMHIRMDPPELGALNVQIDVRDGIVTASFQTSNDEATRLLSHSLGQLRTTLESAGVSVEKLQVQQAPREHFNSSSRDSDRAPGQQAYERSAQDDRQRREMLQRMWRRLTVGRDMLDLVA